MEASHNLRPRGPWRRQAMKWCGRARWRPHLPTMGLGLRDLRVWQESVALGADVVRSLRQATRRETRVVTEHAMITALAVAESVAEGYGRYAPGEQRVLYREAKRHLLRLETSLAIARQAELLSATHHAQLSSRVQTVNRLLGGFLVYLDRQLDTATTT